MGHRAEPGSARNDGLLDPLGGRHRAPLPARAGAGRPRLHRGCGQAPAAGRTREGSILIERDLDAHCPNPVSFPSSNEGAPAMFTVIISEKGGEQRRMEFDKPEVTIGRVQGNDIILPKGNVSKRHSRIVLKDGKFIIVDLKSTNGTYVNGRKITSPLVVKGSDKIYIGDFILSIEELAGAGVAADEGGAAAAGRPRSATIPPPPPAP